MSKTVQKYGYKLAESILGITPDEYALSMSEYYRIYSFYVTYSMSGTQSAKKRSFIDYGWRSNNLKNPELGNRLAEILSLNRNNFFIFTEKDDLREQFERLQLLNGPVENLEYERAVIAHTSAENNYLRLFYRIRDGFAHGKFKLRYSSVGEKMVVIQDNDRDNVTARIVISLSTLLRFIDAIDVNNIIGNY